MNPKEKAKELAKKYETLVYGYKGGEMLTKNSAKAAIIAVDEILGHLLSNEICFDKDQGAIGNFKKWDEVRSELQKL